MKEGTDQLVKFKRLVRSLRVPRPLIIGHLELLWSEAHRRVYSTGSVPFFRSPEDLEIAAEWDGEDGAFARALLDAGWVDLREGNLEVHDYLDHAPEKILKFLERRGLDRPSGRKLADRSENRPAADNGRRTQPAADNGRLQRPQAPGHDPLATSHYPFDEAAGVVGTQEEPAAALTEAVREIESQTGLKACRRLKAALAEDLQQGRETSLLVDACVGVHQRQLAVGQPVQRASYLASAYREHLGLADEPIDRGYLVYVAASVAERVNGRGAELARLLREARGTIAQHLLLRVANSSRSEVVP